MNIAGVRVFLSKVIKKPEFYFCLVFIILNLFFTRQILGVNGVGNFVFVGLIEVAIECASIFVLYKMRGRGEPLEKQFLFLALVLGSLFIILLPPGQSPDDITHFRRAYGISQGVLVPDQVVNDKGAIGSLIPENTDFLSRRPDHGTYEMAAEELFEEKGELSNQPYTSAALYNFICYIPQSIAALIGNIFGISVLGIAYLMDIFNFIVWVILIYFAIKITPRFKSIFLFVSLFPITLQEATSVSPDALTIGLSFFLIAYILYLAYEKKTQMTKKDYVILSLCALVIGFCKIVYLPLIFLMIVIPKERFGTTKKKWIFLGVLLGAVIILNLAWLMFSSRYLVEYRTGVNSKEQLVGILKNPIKYLMVMFRTINVNGQLWMSNILGITLGAFTFNLPNALFFISFAFSILLFMQRNETIKLKKADRWIFLLVFLMIIALIFTSLYMQWTPLGNDVIDGIQGRYFLPIIVLLPIILNRSNKKNYPVVISDVAVLYYSLFLNIVACITVFAQNA